jgi:two-component system, LuxR family, sensor kinase FixL
MNDNISHAQRMAYLSVVTIWLILLITLISSIVTFDLQRARTQFFEKANQLYQQANDRVHIVESILEGFAAMVSVTNDLGRERIRSYAQKMLKQYPYIFMFEIVEKVPNDQIDSFVKYYRRNFYPEFEVKGFSYESDRQWQPISENPFHLPIVFMEPFPEESRKVLGLDISSNVFFMQAIRESEAKNRSVASDPFKLVEGYQAYIIQRPTPASSKQLQPHSSKNGADSEFAVLVVRTDTLLDRKPQLLPGMRELLYKVTYSETDPKGHLQQHKTPAASWLESKIFPHLHVTMELDSKSQPFVLLAEQQLGWEIISWGKLGFSLLAAFFTFGAMLTYARLYFRNEIARTERYLQISKAMIIGLDRNGNVSLINRQGCELLGYTEKEILGKNWFETVVPDNSRDQVYKDFQRIIAGEIKPLKQHENNILAMNGATRFIDWNNDVETNQKGEIIGTLSSGQDITDRKLAEEKALRQHREMAHIMRLSTMGEMATGMAHELNQPLTALVGYCGTAEALLNSLPAPPQQLIEILSHATEQAHRAGDIIRHLREFVSKKDQNIEIFDLDQVIRDIITFLEWEIQENGVIIQFHPGGHSRNVQACKIQIEQVLINLLQNSLEAIRDGNILKGRVAIKSCLLTNDMIEVTVTDNGPGIEASIADGIFHQFRTSKKTGMGIGLSLSRTIIEAHAGKLWVDNNYQNGALFGFVLPAI